MSRARSITMLLTTELCFGWENKCAENRPKGPQNILHSKYEHRGTKYKARIFWCFDAWKIMHLPTFEVMGKNEKNKDW